MSENYLISYAQNAEDIVLWRALSHIKEGFYIDVGANHPTQDSVTRLFYERDWRGINIEPQAQYFELLEKIRPLDINLNLAISNMDGEKDFYQFNSPYEGLSTLNEKIAQTYLEKQFQIQKNLVKTHTLNTLLELYKVEEIHFLKIDVEGGEKNVLEGLDLKLHRPWVIIIESINPGSHVKNHDLWEHILLGNGYTFSFWDGINRFYIAAEHINLIDKLNFPAGILDNFIPFKYKKMEEQNFLLNQKNSVLNADLEILNWKLKNILSGFAWKIVKAMNGFFNVCKSIMNFLLHFIFKFIILSIRSIPPLKKLFRSILVKFPKKYDFFQKTLQSLDHTSWVIALINKFSFLKKIIIKVFSRYPRIAKYFLDLFNITERNSLNLTSALKEKKRSEFILNEIDFFKDNLKLEIEMIRNKR